MDGLSLPTLVFSFSFSLHSSARLRPLGDQCKTRSIFRPKLQAGGTCFSWSASRCIERERAVFRVQMIPNPRTEFPQRCTFTETSGLEARHSQPAHRSSVKRLLVSSPLSHALPNFCNKPMSTKCSDLNYYLHARIPEQTRRRINIDLGQLNTYMYRPQSLERGIKKYMAFYITQP